MKKASDETHLGVEEMLPEYELSGGVRGKYARAYREGHSVTVHRKDGTTVVEHFAPTAGSIVLDPDVRPYFPDSEAVNEALRGLIRLAPARARQR